MIAKFLFNSTNLTFFKYFSKQNGFFGSIITDYTEKAYFFSGRDWSFKKTSYIVRMNATSGGIDYVYGYNISLSYYLQRRLDYL